MSDAIFRQELSFKMIRESIFSLKIDDKVSLRGKFSNFLKPTIFRDTQMSESCIIKWVNLLLEIPNICFIWKSGKL